MSSRTGSKATEKPCLKKTKQNNNNKNEKLAGAGEMAQQVRALAPLAEDPGSISKFIHMAAQYCQSGSNGSPNSHTDIQAGKASMYIKKNTLRKVG